MSIETNLRGRLRNTPLPITSGLLPLFEAVVNSIHAIEEAQISSADGVIRIKIDREADQRSLQLDKDYSKKGPEPQADIRSFTISDNGIGFNEANIKAFKTLDTDHKASKGCRGVGRLLWLKAFEKVEVRSSYYGEDGELNLRTFIFDAGSGVRNESETLLPKDSNRNTVLSLMGFSEKYRKNAYKSAQTIANSIFEHCLWYFVRDGGAPQIFIEDSGELIDLHDVYEAHMHSSATPEVIKIKGRDFELLHIKLRANSSSDHAIAYCADNRLVCQEKLGGKIPGLHGFLSDENGEFIYLCYVSSGVLNESARPERTGFDFAGDLGELFADKEIGWDDIRQAVYAKSAEHLESSLAGVHQRSRERVQRFVSTKAPRYRPIISRLNDEMLNIDPDISDKDLDITMHRHLAILEEKLLADGHDLMAPHEGDSEDDYRTRLNEYLRTADDIKRSDLANYVSHRKVILDLLEAAIQRKPDGKYSREDLIHSLIMPMRKSSDEVLPSGCNLWLVDERLAFHDYLGSDKTLASIPVTGSNDTHEPDLMALNVYDNPLLVSGGPGLPLASIVVVEIKRPMRNDAGPGEIDDPIEQALGYLERIRAGHVSTATGRPIPKSDEIPGYCYVICDITPSFEKRCKVHDLTATSDKMGFFTYKASYKAYVEVISYDRLVNAAKERNKAFFDKLGLPTT
jgi:hypothetical protein